MEKIPKDQFLCPLCESIPVIKNVHTDNGHIELIKNHEKYIEKTLGIFDAALNKINIIHNLLKFKQNDKLGK